MIALVIDLDQVITATLSALLPAGIIGGWVGVHRILSKLGENTAMTAANTAETRQLRVDLTTHMEAEESDRTELHRQTKELGKQTGVLTDLIAVRRSDRSRRVLDPSDEVWERRDDL